MSSILSCHAAITARINLQLKESPHQFAFEHQSGHLVDRTRFVSHFSYCAAVMTQLAATQSTFQSLTERDQLTLLSHNIPLYIQYIMSRSVRKSKIEKS